MFTGAAGCQGEILLLRRLLLAPVTGRGGFESPITDRPLNRRPRRVGEPARLYALEARQPLEEPEALVDLRPGEAEEAVEAEGLDAERGERAPHDDGATEGLLVEHGGAREVAEKTAGEGVARPRGVE